MEGLELDPSSESKGMQDSENSCYFEDVVPAADQSEELPSATNTVLNNKLQQWSEVYKDCDSDVDESKTKMSEAESSDNIEILQSDPIAVLKSKSISEGLQKCGQDRKLSLEHSMPLKREGLSQSEVDLHSIGQSRLERKTSFFKKKMSSFVRNTSAIFKRQTQSNKEESKSEQMSLSQHSLNEASVHDLFQLGSVPNLPAVITPAPSCSSISASCSDLHPHLSEESLVGSRSAETFADGFSSNHSLNVSHESPLNTRAISMSSGLDSAKKQERRNSARSNRVTWLASETLANYFRRMSQDLKTREQGQLQDFSTIPENKLCEVKDCKGRRYSYVRAVSREDPVLPTRYYDTLRKKKVLENEMWNVTEHLNSYTDRIPSLENFEQHAISEEANEFLVKLKDEGAIDEMFSFVGELNHRDAVRQCVIKELVYTEAVHIHHLQVIVSVYIASAHDLQKNGYMMDLNTGLLFQNIPDVLNANIVFWEKCIFPMLYEAYQNETLFDTNKMIPALNEFSEMFGAYIDYVYGQANASLYLRDMTNEASNNAFIEFVQYLDWCNANTKNRLQLADMLIKPFQRLSKYSLLISRIAAHEDDIQKQADLEHVNGKIKCLLASLNRDIAQKEALLQIENLTIEAYDPEFKHNEELAQPYRRLSKLNLFGPMIDCDATAVRSLIHEGNLRYKDVKKEFDCRVFLFTDMMLICKKPTKTSTSDWKLARPKVFLHRVVPFIKPAKSPSESAAALVMVILDEHGASESVFQLTELTKDPLQSLKEWETRIQEALITYTLLKWYHTHPVSDIDTIIREPNDIYKMVFDIIKARPLREYLFFQAESSDQLKLEQRARERVAATLQPNKFMEDTSIEYKFMMAGDPERGPSNLHLIMESGINHYNAWQSRGSAFHQYVTSNCRPEASNFALRFHYGVDPTYDLRTLIQRSGSSAVIYTATEPSIAGIHRSPSITINNAPDAGDAQRPPTLTLQQSSPRTSPGPRSASAGAGSEYMHWLTPTHPGGHSMPDINVDYHMPESITVETASERLYRSHQELMQKNRLAAEGHYMTADHRGTSYPPPVPTRASLKRGMAFSYSFKSNPPLTRSKNVGSTSSQVQTSMQKIADVPRRILGRRSPQPTDQQPSTSKSMGKRTTSPCTNKDSKSRDKPQKKSRELITVDVVKVSTDQESTMDTFE